MSGRRKNRWLFFLLLLFSSGAGAQFMPAPVISTFDTRANVVPWVPVKVNRQWGYADTSGRVMIAPQFDAADQFFGKYAVVQKGNKAYVIDTSGTILTPKGHDQILQLEDSIFAVYKNSNENGEGGWGAEKLGGTEILSTSYDKIGRLSYYIFSCQRDSFCGYFSRYGTVIAPVKYDTGWVLFARYLVVKRNNLLGAFSATGTQVLPDSCTDIDVMTNSILRGEINGKYGAVHESGKNVVPFEYTMLSNLGSRFMFAQRRDTVHIYCNDKGRVDGNYMAATAFGSFWVKAYTREKKCAVIDTSGKVIIPPLYDDVLFAGDGTWIVINDGKRGVVNKDGKIIVPVVYTFLPPFRQSMTVVFSGQLQGLINSKGETLVPLSNCVITLKGKVAKVMRPGQKAEFIKTDGNGKVLSRDEYEDVRVIKIGGDNSYKENTKVVPGGGSGGGLPNGKLMLAPKADSLVWFFDASKRKYGLLDTYLGDTLQPAIYTLAFPFRNGLTMVARPDTVRSIILGGAALETGLLYGLFDDSLGKFLIQPRYPMLAMYKFSSNRQEIIFRCVTRDGQQGLVKADGNEKVLLASFIGVLSDGAAPFCIGGKWEFSNDGTNRTSWAQFAEAYAIVNDGPFRNASESRAAGNHVISHVGGKWGFIDADGKILVPAQYESYQASQDGTCLVRLDKKWGMIDTTGKVLMPFAYDMVNYISLGGNTMVQTQMNTTQMGCMDTLGNIVVPIQYRKIIHLGNGFIGVSTNGKWGVSRSNGAVITEEKYLEISPFTNGYAAVRTGRKWGIIDSTGAEITSPVYDAVATFSEGMCGVKQSLYWGFVNTSGTLVVPCNYTGAGSFLRNAAPVRTRTGWALINKEGKEITKPNFSLIEQVGTAPVFSFRKDGATGLLSTEGKVILPAKYAKVKDIGMNRIAFLEGLRWGIMDTLGVVLERAIFDKVGVFSEGMCPVALGSTWGYIGENGRYRIKPVFRTAAPFGDGLAYVVTFSDGSGFIDTLGKMQFSVTGNIGTTPFHENKTAVRWKHNYSKYSVYTRFGHRLTRDGFAEVLPFYHGAAPVKSDGKWGLINFSGRFIVMPYYSNMTVFKAGISIVQTNATYGLHTLDGKQVLAPEYDAIRNTGTLLRIQSDNKVGYLSRTGKVIWTLQE